jgi:hypothetical protein
MNIDRATIIQNRMRHKTAKRASGSLDPVVRPTTTEIVYTWPDGREEVRYRRDYDSVDALRLIAEVADLRRKHGKSCPYSYRHVV